MYFGKPVSKLDFTLQYLTVVGTISAVFVALFVDQYKRWCYKPCIEIQNIDMKNPFSFAKTKVDTKDLSRSTNGVVDGYILRLAVRNNGLGWAENVQIRIESAVNQHNLPNGPLAPINLVWLNQDGANEAYMDKITLSKMYLGLDYYCNLAEIIPSTTIFAGNLKQPAYLQFVVGKEPFNKSNQFNACYQTFKYRLTLFAKNFMPKSYILSLSYKQDSTEMSQMYNNEFLDVSVNPE